MALARVADLIAARFRMRYTLRSRCLRCEQVSAARGASRPRRARSQGQRGHKDQ